MINFDIFKIFAAWQDGAKSQGGAVLSQIYLAFCRLKTVPYFV